MSNPPQVSVQVSVIVPVFNSDATIQRALDSIAAQTFTDYEIIVVDDASTDRTVEAVTHCAGDRVTLLRHPHNRGAAAARNTGIAAARGRWVAFLDSDDAWKPGKLARQLTALKESPGIPACVSGYDLHKDGRTVAINLPILPRHFRREILFGCTIGPGICARAARRCVCVVIGANQIEAAHRSRARWD